MGNDTNIPTERREMYEGMYITMNLVDRKKEIQPRTND
jgi:hypothetical protein